jgi:hypothetical protein
MNRITIEPTIFEDSWGAKTYGYRIYDNYAKDYDDCMNNVPDDNFELLEYVVKNQSEIVQGMLDHVIATKSGLDIAGSWYDYDEVKHILNV